MSSFPCKAVGFAVVLVLVLLLFRSGKETIPQGTQQGVASVSTLLQASNEPTTIVPAGKGPLGRQGWVVPFGGEFWLRNRGSAEVQRPFDIAKVVDRVSHRFGWDTQAGGYQTEGVGYRLALESDGVRFAPFGPGTGSGSAGPEFQFRTVGCQQGGVAWDLDQSEGLDWTVAGNTAQTLLEPTLGLVEHYDARASGVELTWVLSQAPSQRGGLSLEVSVQGAETWQETANGLHLAGSDGIARMRIGNPVAIDQSGKKWPLGLEATDAGFEVIVSEEILAQASFPLAIDPLISPEFGMDQPIASTPSGVRATPVVAAGDDSYVVAWVQGKGNILDPGIYAARFDANGQMLDPYGILLSSTAGEQSVCSVAALRNEFLVVWSAPRGTSTTDWDLLGVRIRGDGALLDATPLPVAAVASSVQSSPAVASNGDNYLVVWRDSRSTGIYGTMVSTNGVVFPTNGMPISAAASDQYTPSVAALDANYLVVWQDYRKATSSQYYSDIYGARVTGGGVLMDTTGIAICTRTNSQYHPSVAAGATNYFVVWENYDRDGNDLAGARVSAEGVVLDPVPLSLGHAPSMQANPVVAKVENGFLMAWQEYGNSPTNDFAGAVFIMGVTEEGVVGGVGAPMGIGILRSESAQATPSLAVRGHQVLIVWEDFSRSEGLMQSEIQAARLDLASGVLVQPAFVVSSTVNGQATPASASIGANFLVVWADDRNQAASGMDVYGALVGSDGGLLTPTALAISTAANRQVRPAVAVSGTNYLVAWADYRNTPPNASHADIYGSLVTDAGEVLHPTGIPFCTATNDQTAPAISPLNDGYLVVWQDARTSSGTAAKLDIFGSRVSATGGVLDPAGIPICTQAANQTLPAAAGDAGQALVVWTDARNGAATDIYGTRLDAGGQVLDTNAIAIGKAPLQQSAPSVAANGAGYLVVWVDTRNGANNPDIYGTFVTHDGAVQSTNGLAVRVAPGQQSAPSVTAQGSDYVVAWQESNPGTTQGADVYAAWIGASGSGLGAFPLLVNTKSFDQSEPALATGTDGRVLIASQGFGYSAPRAVGNVLQVELLPRLDSAGLSVIGQFEFRLRGAAGATYVVESSEDLLTWTPGWTNVLSNTTFLFSDPATNTSHRFYRAILMP
jgi:hypothetical protein